MIDLLWWAGVVIVNLAVLPQLVKILTTRSVRDLSLGREIMLLAAFLLFEAWYVANRVYPPGLTNLLSIAAALTTILVILHYRRPRA